MIKTHDDVLAVLKRTRAFSEWPIEALTELASKCEIRTYKDGEVATRAGDTADAIWLVAEGAFFLTKTMKDGRRFVHGHLMAGQMTGIMPVFDGMPAALDATARGESVVLYVVGAVFRDVVRRYADASIATIAYLCRRARLDYERIELLTMDTVRVRLAKVILYLARGEIQPGTQEVVANPKISQEDIAGMIGATRQTANREYRRMIEEGILKPRYGGVVIADLNRLVAIAADEGTLPQVVAEKLEPDPRYFPTTD